MDNQLTISDSSVVRSVPDGHQNCGICRPEKKGGRAYEDRETKLEIDTQMSEDKDLILSSINWVQWPLLPLINRTENKCGFIVDCKENRFRVYLANIFELDGKTSFDKLPFEDFSSADEILAGGWVVD